MKAFLNTVHAIAEALAQAEGRTVAEKVFDAAFGTAALLIILVDALMIMAWMP